MRIIFSRYKEACDNGYNFHTEEADSATSHFTQLVWKGSKRFGIGIAEAERDGNDNNVGGERSKCYYVVARYRDPGNMIGEYRSNIPKGKFDHSTCTKIRGMAEDAMKKGNVPEPEHQKDEKVEIREVGK